MTGVSKVNIIEQLEFELTYDDVAVQHISYYATASPQFKLFCLLVLFFFSNENFLQRITQYVLAFKTAKRSGLHPGDLGSIPGRVIPKTFKMVLDTSLLNTQQLKVHIKGKAEQSRKRSSTLPYTLV